MFSVLFYCNSNNNDGTLETPIVKETKILKADGEQTGEYVIKAGEEGLVLFKCFFKEFEFNTSSYFSSIIKGRLIFVFLKKKLL